MFIETTSSPAPGVRSTHNVVSLQRVHIGVEVTRSDSVLPGHCEARNVSAFQQLIAHRHFKFSGAPHGADSHAPGRNLGLYPSAKWRDCSPREHLSGTGKWDRRCENLTNGDAKLPFLFKAADCGQRCMQLDITYIIRSGRIIKEQLDLCFSNHM